MNSFSVFTKPWKMPLPELGKFVKGMGFDGIELPVRPGYQVEPGDAAKGLPEAVKVLREQGVKIVDVAAEPDANIIAACGGAGIGLIRNQFKVNKGEGYLAAEQRLRKEFDALVPLLDKSGVTIGVQNHSGSYVAPNAIGLRHLVEKYDPHHVAVVWDAGHEAIMGGEPEDALDEIWDHLKIVNLKNPLYKPANDLKAAMEKNPKTGHQLWKKTWVGGREGFADWQRVANELKHRNYPGPVCLTAEYSEEKAVERLIKEDIAYAKALFA